jgi:hypothetical protein
MAGANTAAAAAPRKAFRLDWASAFITVLERPELLVAGANAAVDPTVATRARRASFIFN